MVVLAATRGGGVARAHPAAPVVSIASAKAANAFLTTQFYRGSPAARHGAGQSKNPYRGLPPVDFAGIGRLLC
jgi:hypothetical protein